MAGGTWRWCVLTNTSLEIIVNMNSEATHAMHARHPFEPGVADSCRPHPIYARAIETDALAEILQHDRLEILQTQSSALKNEVVVAPLGRALLRSVRFGPAQTFCATAEPGKLTALVPLQDPPPCYVAHGRPIPAGSFLLYGPGEEQVSRSDEPIGVASITVNTKGPAQSLRHVLRVGRFSVSPDSSHRHSGSRSPQRPSRDNRAHLAYGQNRSLHA